MDVKRVVVYSGLFFISMVLWSTWQKEHISAPLQQSAQVVSQAVKAGSSSGQNVKNVNAVPVVSEQAMHKPAPASRVVNIQSDVLDLKVDALGGKLISAKLLNYASQLHKKDAPYVLLNDKSDSLYIAKSRFADSGAKKATPIMYHVTQRDVRMADGEKAVAVTLTGTTHEGAIIKKTLTLKRNDYAVGVQYQIKNPTQQAVSGHIFSEISRKKPETASSGNVFNIRSYTGASISDPNNKLFEKVSFKNMAKENLNRSVDGGWVAMQQHYFLTAWVPSGDKKNTLYSHKQNDIFTIGLMGPELTVPAGKTVTVESNLYVGPEITSTLKQLAPGLNLTIDYGIFWFLSSPLFWLMKHIYLIIGNWGWSIILVTMLIKLAFYKLSASSYRSMANMRRLQPKIEAMKKRYGDDKQKLSQATIELYKTEKVNPLGGCLPILIQIPVFIALYWVLLESVELRHAPFMLWIHDLSARDPYFVLPVIMGITMLIQQKLNPPPPDPMQAKVMMLLPVLFTVLFLQFPAGLVLYWVVNNSLSILQQWYITKKFEAQTPARK